jgi:alpha-tubulin suppressor-like RCC1 family protein
MSIKIDTGWSPVNPTRGSDCTYRLRLIPTLSLLLTVAACREEQSSPTDPTPSPALSTVAAALSFNQVSGGNVHSCGLTTDNLAYCWGHNGSGALGTGTESGPETCTGAVGPFPCSTRPAAVTGAHRFRQISAGGAHTCAVTTSFQAYCWGSAGSGKLGHGIVSNDRPSPTLVQGGVRFRQVDAGANHTCGVSEPDRRAYCWGDNGQGQLGDGTRTLRRQPVPVFGNLRFREVRTGNFHTCGVTTSNVAYCWGRDEEGQLGNDALKARKAKPVLVAGGHQFRQLDVGRDHSCAVTTGNQAFCWGDGAGIGDGQAIDRFIPRAVAGGLNFRRVSGGGGHTCGETTTSRGYCWGNNPFGQLGDGSETSRLRPVAVAGGLSFAQLSAGDNHACGKTQGSVAYCWGYGFFGQLGNGESGFDAERHAPVAVAGPI